MLKRLVLLAFMMVFATGVYAQKIYEVKNGSIRFFSDAPQELIRASSDQLKGVFDTRKKTFAFRIDIGSFMGFNSPLQREHFNENYMETTKFPTAVYSGKIIEDVDITKDGEYNVRAKGKLNIHGMEQERIINTKIKTKNGKCVVRSEFIVPLADHHIKIPRVVYDKLSPEINVQVNATLLPRP